MKNTNHFIIRQGEDAYIIPIAVIIDWDTKYPRETSYFKLIEAFELGIIKKKSGIIKTKVKDLLYTYK